MVKLFSKSKGKSGPSASPAPTKATPAGVVSSSAAADIRAEYYANRNDNTNNSSNGGVGARTITTNGAAAAAAAGSAPPNPFADDSDDEDDGTMTNANNGGGRNKNPFDVVAPAIDPLAAFRKTPAKSTMPPTTAPNPFADNDSDDDDDESNVKLPPPPNSRSIHPANIVQRSTAMTNNNPFCDDSGNSILPTKSSTANPFDDDEEEEEDKASRRPMDLLVGMGKMNSKRLNADNDPFLQEVVSSRKSPKAIPPPPSRPAPPPPKPAPPPVVVNSTPTTSNPFEDDEEEEEEEEEVITARTKSMAASGVAVAIPRSPSTRMNKSTKQPLPPPSSSAPAPPVAASRESIDELRNRLSGGGGAPPRSAPSSNPPSGSAASAVKQRPITAPIYTPSEGGDKKLSSAGGVSGNAVGLTSWLRGNKKVDSELLVGSGSAVGDKKNANNISTSTSPFVDSSMMKMDNAPASSVVGDLERKMQIHNLVGNLNGNQTNIHYNGVFGGTNKKRKPKKKKCSVVTPWPFDNYHEVQQEAMYEELASRAASDYNGAGTDHGEYAYGGESNNNNDTKKDDNSRSRAKANQGWAKLKTASQKGGFGRFANVVTIAGGGGGGGGGINNNNRDTITYERPEELPSIKEAVNDLPLIDFEMKAEERAINIVSTWLFDAGLIDELLVNGATVSTPHQQQQISSNATTMSEKTSEGQEIGAHGFLVGVQGADLKMDKETNKLRTMIQRDLSIINARLNDGVAASGLEVQELVNAVIAAKEDIGRLRELTTYISDEHGPNSSRRDEFLLAKYPYLRKAINARRNINRCFRELDFFGHIPSTCERLRDDLNSGEYTEEEWTTIQNVSMEHVELEIMLVEAEDSMKSGAHSFNDAVVDTFLETHVQNVWELGDEIRMRILSGIGTAFELSKNNPSGMVALVEAVEVYERAAETFEKKRDCGFGATSNGGDNRLRFTDMRAAALEQLYQDFELRGVEMFRGVHEHAADLADEDDAANVGFTAVLKAATELVTEIDIVKDQMSPCFAPHWHVEALWSSCVAHVCSNHIVQQIGGPDGQSLPDLTITQLLELVAWVEYFRETIEETFPAVALLRNTKKTYYDMNGPELFTGDKRTVNMKNATESIAWVNNMLWEVHRLAQEEFLVRTRSQTDEWLDKVYGSESVKNQSAEGKLTTSLCEDIFSFTSVQLQTIRERLSKKSDALILAVCIILSHMRSKQVHARNNTLQDLETCCAASNDFTRMSEKTEDMVAELMSECEFSEDMVATLEASCEELMGVYSSDAVYSARSVHIYVFDPIEEEIGVRLFEEDWENVMIDNDLAISLVRTLEDFHEDLVHYMDDFMVVKSMMSLMSATVIFYAKCLLQRAETHRNNKKPYFGDVKTALDRMTGDIKVLRDYFEGLVPQMPTLKKNVDKDFEILTTIHELLSIAAGISVSEVEDFILVLQKRVRDVGITKHIVGDMWHLVAPTEERYVWELVESMEERLTAIAPPDDALALEVNDRAYVKGLRLDEMAVKLIIKSRRNRPIKASAVENIVKNWGKTWFAGNEDVIHDETLKMKT